MSADAIPVSCPNCKKRLQVPATLAGKTIKCKECDTAFKIPGGGAGPVARAKPAAAPPPKKVKKATLAEPKGRFEDEEDNADPYGLIKNAEEDIARCPHCADVLDPPDTKVCLTCGYDLLARSRHETRKVWEHTFGDYVMHHFLTFVAFLVLLALIAVIVVCVAYMGDVFAEIGLQDEKENEVTKKKEYFVPPGACSTPIVVFSLFGIYRSGRFVIKRLFVDWRPPEKIKK